MSKKKSNKKIKILGFLLIVLSVFIFLSLIATSPYGSVSGGHDDCSVNFSFSKQTDNVTGTLGDTFYCFLRYKGFGLASFLIPFMFFLWGVVLIRKDSIKKNLIRTAHVSIGIIFFSVYSAAFTDGAPTWSGKFGASIYDWLNNRLDFGLWILGVAIIFVYVSVIFNISISEIFQKIIELGKKYNDRFLSLYHRVKKYFKARKVKKIEAKENQVNISINEELNKDIEEVVSHEKVEEILEDKESIEDKQNVSDIIEKSSEDELAYQEDSIDLDIRGMNVQITEEKN